MKNYTRNRKVARRNEQGFTLVGVLILVTLGLLIAAGLTQSASSTSSVRSVIDTNTDDFYAVERSINTVTAWMQSNSKNLVSAFNSANFSTNFDLGSPTIGDNEGSSFTPPTLIKMKGTQHSVMLTNSSFFGTSYFPTTQNVDTNASFNAVSSFQSANFGSGVNVRVLAIWATQTDGHYQPILRVDAVTGGNQPEHGVHGFNFIRSALVATNGGVGYYADLGDFQTGNPNNECYSYAYTYDSAAGTWSRGAARSNCLITARDDIQLKSKIHGNVYTLKTGGINLDGGSVSGQTCQGPTCAVTYTLPNPPSWTTRCAGVPAVDVTASANPTTINSGNTLASQCFRTITVGSGKGIKLGSADYPYYIKTLDLQNNSNSTISFAGITDPKKYTLYIDSITGDKINGNQLVSLNLAPHQLEINLTQDGNLMLNGTAAMNAVINGNSNHTINYSGTFTFCGALRSDAVSVSGNAVLCYDEALGGVPALTDLNFTLYKASQRYR